MPTRFDSFDRGGVPLHIANRGSGDPPTPPSDLTRQLSLPPWDQHKPPTAHDFYSFTRQSLTLPAGAGASVETTQATGGFVKLGSDNIGVLEVVILTIDAPTGLMNFDFSVMQNGTAIPGLANIGFPPINAASFVFPIKSRYQLQAGALIHVDFTNRGASGPWTLGIVLSGYQVPAADVYQYTGQRQGMIETGADAIRAQRYLAR